ncbi:MAG: AAA family ATPase [Thiolinea sp.]
MPAPWMTGFPQAETALQKRAVERAAHAPFLIISGGPGTGKTTTVTRLLWLLLEQLGVQPGRILLAAPTGKAAMRMQEAIRQSKQALQIPAELAARIPEQGSTLHRLLGYISGKVSFRHDAHNPLAADVVIVDEASMIDISLMTHLFEAVSPAARLILLGDRDQLASVETGSIFRDLCALAPDSPHPLDAQIVMLEKSWRFAAGGGIAQLAAAVRDRQEQNLLDLLQSPPAGISWHAQTRLDGEQLQTAWEDYLAAVREYSRTGTPAELERIFTAFNRFRILTPCGRGRWVPSSSIRASAA